MYSFKHAGKKFQIPLFTDIPMGVIRKSRRASDDMDKAFIILETLMGEGSPEMEAVDSMNAAEFQEFLAGWTQGAPVGESVSSES